MENSAFLLSESSVSSLFHEKVLSLNPTHKGDRGHLLVVGGADGTYGAPILAAQAGFRAGAGLVTLLSEKSVNLVAAAHSLELMSANVTLYSESGLSLKEYLKRSISCAVVGPGLVGAESVVSDTLKQFAKTHVPVVIDASALRYLARNQTLKTFLRTSSVLTPHPGELGELLDISPTELQKDRQKWGKIAAEKFNAVVVVKGPETVIAGPKGELLISPWSHPNLATAGSGDVLGGLIGGLISRGVPSLEAAIIAVFIHGWSGSTLQTTGGVGSLAHEFANDFPKKCAVFIEKNVAK